MEGHLASDNGRSERLWLLCEAMLSHVLGNAMTSTSPTESHKAFFLQDTGEASSAAVRIRYPLHTGQSMLTTPSTHGLATQHDLVSGPAGAHPGMRLMALAC